MRLIDADELLNEVRNNKELYERERVYLEGLLLNAPTVEERPQVDLISREALKKALDEQMNFDENCRDSVFDIVNNAPTVTVEPETKVVANVSFNEEQLAELVKEAKDDILKQMKIPKECKWIFDDDNDGVFKFMKCDRCGEAAEWLDGGSQFLSKFCPNCGADMRGNKE